MICICSFVRTHVHISAYLCIYIYIFFLPLAYSFIKSCMMTCMYFFFLSAYAHASLSTTHRDMSYLMIYLTMSARTILHQIANNKSCSTGFSPSLSTLNELILSALMSSGSNPLAVQWICYEDQRPVTAWQNDAKWLWARWNLSQGRQCPLQDQSCRFNISIQARTRKKEKTRNEFEHIWSRMGPELHHQICINRDVARRQTHPRCCLRAGRSIIPSTRGDLKPRMGQGWSPPETRDEWN